MKCFENSRHPLLLTIPVLVFKMVLSKYIICNNVKQMLRFNIIILYKKKNVLYLHIEKIWPRMKEYIFSNKIQYKILISIFRKET